MQFQNAAYEASYGTAQQLPGSEMPEIAFSGRSNVGKSSLLNKLLNRKSLARVSATPGKTATINFYKLPACRFVDLPGYGYAKVSSSEQARWGRLMDTYFSSGRRIALVVQLIDMRHSPSKLDLQMLEFLAHNDFPFVIALTKSDKLNQTQRKERLAALLQELAFLGREIVMIPFSATKGEGTLQLQEQIAKAVEA